MKALVDGDIQITNICTASPNIKSDKLVALEDPDGLFFADDVVPVVSEKVDEKAARVLNEVSAALYAVDFVSLNSESINEQKSAEDARLDLPDSPPLAYARDPGDARRLVPHAPTGHVSGLSSSNRIPSMVQN